MSPSSSSLEASTPVTKAFLERACFISLKTCQQSFCPWNVRGRRLLGNIPSSGRCKGLVAGMELKGSLACPTSCPPHCSPGSSAGKECLQCMRPWFDSWVRKIPWRRDRLPTPVFLGFPGGSAGKESSHNVGDPGLIPGLGNPLEKEKATHSSILAWRIPWTTVSVQFSCSVVSDSLRPHEPQHARPPCPSPTPGVHPNPCPSSRWCYPTISSSVVPFSSCPQSFPASGSFQMSQLFTDSKYWSIGGQSIGVSASASVLQMNTQDWSPLGWTGWISLQSKGLSRVFSNTTVQKHQFFNIQLSL